VTSAVHPVWWLRAQAGARIAVEVLIEQKVVAPPRTELEDGPLAEHWPAAIFILQKEAREPPRELGRNVVQVQLDT
jgi:hypothetical protein